MYITSSSLWREIMTKNKHRRKRPEQPLDLALVIGLTAMIKQLAQINSARMEFADLELIERFEKGRRRQAIKHIRATATPHSLGLRTTEPRSKGPNPARLLAKMWQAGQPCPRCKKGRLADQTKGERRLTACNKCRFYVERVAFDYKPNKDVQKFLSDLHTHQILSHWAGLNNPNPIYFAAKAA